MRKFLLQNKGWLSAAVVAIGLSIGIPYGVLTAAGTVLDFAVAAATKEE